MRDMSSTACRVSLFPALFALMVVACGGASSTPPAGAGASTASTSVRPGYDGVLPPLPVVQFASARPAPLTRAAYQFAARHPEVLKHMPCFCGCERNGHGSNEDCFVARRNANGSPEWSPHGIGCGICIDVALAAQQHARLWRIRRRHPARDRSEIQVGVPHQYADAASAPVTVVARTKPSAEAFARLFESVHEGVYIGTVNGAASQTLAANPHLKLMFGFGVEAAEHEVRPFELERFVDPQARDGFLSRLQRDGAVRDYLLRLRRADKTPMWVEVTAHAERGRDGLRIEALVRDVSERKRLEDQARDLYHQLLQAEKLAALGQTISGVAHELNNPLATILTWAERLSQRPADDHTRRGLEAILSESERAAKIVRNLLTFARKRHTTRAMVDLNQVVRETLALRSYEQRVNNVTDDRGACRRAAAGICRSASDSAGPAQPDHQRRAGHGRRQRTWNTCRAHVA